MAIQTQSESPDTCAGAAQNLGCKIWYEYDDSAPADQIVYTPVAIERRCTRHNSTSFPTIDSVFTEMRENQVRKNKIIARIQQVVPTWYDPDYGTMQLGASWLIDAGGTLRVTCPPGTSTVIKNALKAFADATVGMNKVMFI